MPLSPEPKKPEELGFYMPDSPYAKRDNTFHKNKDISPELVAGAMAAAHAEHPLGLAPCAGTPMAWLLHPTRPLPPLAVRPPCAHARATQT